MKKKIRASNQINVFNRQRGYRLSPSGLKQFAYAAAEAAGLSGRELTLLFVGVDRMTKLNAAFRGKSGATDVLSFGSGDPALPGKTPRASPRYLGDIAICPAVAAQNTRCLALELKVLVLHGMLHLMGYDHVSDQGEMRRLELKLRRTLGLR